MSGKRFLALALAGCGHDPSHDGEHHDLRRVELAFDARYGDHSLACGPIYDATGLGSTTLRLADLRMYVSDLALITHGGDEVPVAPTSDRRWQGDGVALLDFDDGSGSCADLGDPAINRSVTGEVPHGDYDGLSFTVGVPEDLDRQPALETVPPLDLPTMQEATGHDFLRLDVYNDLPAPNDLWVLRIASAGCGTDPTVPCARSNRARISLSGFDPASDAVSFDVRALLTGGDLEADSGDGPSGCTSEDMEICPSLFDNLGLDWATGECADGCTGQTVFGVE